MLAQRRAPPNLPARALPAEPSPDARRPCGCRLLCPRKSSGMCVLVEDATGSMTSMNVQRVESVGAARSGTPFGPAGAAVRKRAASHLAHPDLVDIFMRCSAWSRQI
jgi:hypothetical protein